MKKPTNTISTVLWCSAGIMHICKCTKQWENRFWETSLPAREQKHSIRCSVCCSVFSVLQCVAVCCSVLQCVVVRCSVLQCVAVCSSVLQCVAVCCSVLQRVAVCCSVLQCVAMCCSVLQCAAVCCSVLQCVAVCWRLHKLAGCHKEEISVSILHLQLPTLS